MVRIDRNEVAVELVDLFHAEVLVRAGQLLDIILSADVREVYRRLETQEIQIWYSPYLGLRSSLQSILILPSVGRTNTIAYENQIRIQINTIKCFMSS